jgi:hypothetical protein
VAAQLYVRCQEILPRSGVLKRLNEFNAVDALIGIVPFLLGCTYSLGGSPDDLDSQQKEIDFVLVPNEPGSPKLAVEHTVVEAYRGQRTYLLKSYEIVQKIDSECQGELPVDRFFGLVLPPELVDQLRRKELDRFIAAIAPWVIAAGRSTKIDDYTEKEYGDHRIFLMCSGSDPHHNGHVGRMPGAPKDGKDKASLSLLRALQHGTSKFAKYKQQGYQTILSLEDVSGAIHPSALVAFRDDPASRHTVAASDYVVEFASNDERMIVGNVWKAGEELYDPPPYDLRFHKLDGKWKPFGDADT